MDEDDDTGLVRDEVPGGEEDLKVTGPVSKGNKQLHRGTGSDYVPDTEIHSSSKTPQNLPAMSAGAAASSGEADGAK